MLQGLIPRGFIGDAQCSKQPEGCLNRQLSCTWDALFGGYNNEPVDFFFEMFQKTIFNQNLDRAKQSWSRHSSGEDMR